MRFYTFPSFFYFITLSAVVFLFMYIHYIELVLQTGVQWVKKLILLFVMSKLYDQLFYSHNHTLQYTVHWFLKDKINIDQSSCRSS